MIFGALEKPSLKGITDLTPREIGFMVPLVLITIGLGFYPKPIFDVTRASVAHLVDLHRQGVAAAQADATLAEARP
jgi:NADH-quinone oxidoreductase subunit M